MELPWLFDTDLQTAMRGKKMDDDATAECHNSQQWIKLRLYVFKLNSWNTWVQDDLKITTGDWPANETKWSTAGKGKNWRKFVGWSRPGIVRYAQLFDAVWRNRLDTTRAELFDAAMKDLVIKTMSIKHQNMINKSTEMHSTTTNAPEESDLMRIMNDME
jgi:hypothetical protein